MSSSKLRIAVDQARGRVPVTIMRIEGSVDAATYQALQTAVDTAYAAGARYVLFDLANVAYMSSAGLRMLHRISDRLSDENAAEGGAATSPGVTGGSFKSPHVKLLNPSKNVSRLLEISGFVLFLDIYTDLDTAIASF
jgi:anti-anti-sigma factor